jgi:hypothetical protein
MPQTLVRRGRMLEWLTLAGTFCSAGAGRMPWPVW